MALFPLFIELSGRRALIVGGGRLALHKARMLLPYGAELTAVAPEFCPELEAMGLGVPQMTRVFNRLRAMGVEVPASVYTIQQAKQAVLDALAAKKGVE